MGPYCNYCGQRCFVPRILKDGRSLIMATCAHGMEHDREATGEDATTAVNPVTLDDLRKRADRALMAYAEAAKPADLEPVNLAVYRYAKERTGAEPFRAEILSAFDDIVDEVDAVYPEMRESIAGWLTSMWQQRSAETPVEPEPLTSFADMADAAWQSVRGLAYGPTLVQATNALRNADGKREPLKVYILACRDSIERARDEAKELDEAAEAVGMRKVAASGPAQIRACDLTVDHIHEVMSGVGERGGEIGMVHGLIIWITFTEDAVRVGVCERPDSGAADVEFAHSDLITIEAGK